VYDELAANRRRSFLMIAAFTSIVFAVGWAFSVVVGGGVIGLIAALVFSIGSSALAYWKSDSIALAMSHAHLADEQQYARLHNVVEGLCIASGLPKPRLYYIEDQAPNAFATGRDPQHAAIAVTTGLLEKMNRIELEAVLAHELGHVKNHDILVSTIAVTMVGTIALLSDFGMRYLWWGGPRHRNDRDDNNGNGAQAIFAVLGIGLLILTPIVAKLMQLAISRKRESLADMTGVSMTKYPPGMISALEKLRDDTTVVHSASKATAHLWMESPLSETEGQLSPHREGHASRFNKLFLTHPPLEDRIAALREL
jgi:heat shock protein HtpX